MAATLDAGYDQGVTTRFPSELRRWRTARRLSQLELAVRAGTTQRHLSFIEQGRSRPGRSIVLRLAESLELTLRERNELLLAAGFAPAFPESPLDDEALRPVRQALDTILDGHLPYPAMVVRPHGVLVTANRAFDVFHEGVDPALLATAGQRVPPRPPPRRRRAPRVATCPSGAGTSPRTCGLGWCGARDPSLEALLAELEGYLPPLPAEADVLGFAVPLELESDDGDLRLITTLTSFATAADVTLTELGAARDLACDEVRTGFGRGR